MEGKIMSNFQKFFIIALTVGLFFGVGAGGYSQPATPSGFDINKVPVVNPPLGKFPYFSLIEGYQTDKGLWSGNKDVAFDRYDFFDGTKIVTVEGRLQTITAKGTGASAFEILKTYESLVKDLGGVRVFEGNSKAMYNRKLEFNDPRHRRHPVHGDELGVYMIRTPNKEIWVEVYHYDHPGVFIGYHLTVVEKRALKVRATLLTAEEIKKELDSKGRVALYINFDTGQADVKPESKPMIGEIAKLLANNRNMKLIIEGHTDNVGRPEFNQRLSEARAQTIAAELTKLGIKPLRLKTVGFGQQKPLDDNSSGEGRANNRRVELVKAN
jgi:OmpA-OmpF porin, OOP family